MLYEGSNITFSVTLSVGIHTIRFQAWDEYDYEDEQWIILHISEYDFLFYSDIFVENFSLPQRLIFGDEVMMNISIRNSGNLGGNVSFILRAVQDSSGENHGDPDGAGSDIIEIFHDIAVVAAGDIYFRQITWIPDSPGYYLVQPVIIDDNGSNDGAIKRIEIYESQSTDDLEGEQLLEPFFYAYPLVIFLVLLFFGIVIVHRVKRRRIEKQQIMNELMGTTIKEPRTDIDENMRELSTASSLGLRQDNEIKRKHVHSERDLPGPWKENNEMQGSGVTEVPDSNLKKTMGEIIADFDDGNLHGSGTHTGLASSTSETGYEALPELEKTNEDIISIGSEKNAKKELPERVREMFEGL